MRDDSVAARIRRSAGRLLVASRDLLEHSARRGLDFVVLRDDDPGGTGAREVVEDRGAAVVVEHVAQGNDGNLIDGGKRALGGGIVGAKRFDGVADELQPYRVRLAGRKDIDDPAADGELAVLVGRVFAGEAGIDEQFGQISGRDVEAWLQLEGRGGELFRRADARQQSGRGGDDDARRAMGEGVKCAGARRGDSDVGREAAVRIDLVGRERQHGMAGR